MRRKFLMVGWLALALLGLNVSTMVAQDEPAMMTRVYDVSDLLASDYVPQFHSQQWPGTGMFSNVRSVPTTVFAGGLGGLGGGGGGMGGGGMGGGGLFAVAPSQMGSQSAGGGGVGSAPPQMLVRQAVPSDLATEAEHLSELIQNFVSQNAWSDMGGPGECRHFNGMLVIRQTESAHQEIEQLLEQLRLTQAETRLVQLDWVAIQASPAAHRIRELSPEQLSTLVDENWSQRGGVTTLNGRLAFTTAAEHRNLVISVQPVVGAGGPQGLGSFQEGNVGYSPQTVKSALGWVVQLRPIIGKGQAAMGRIQVGASYTDGPQDVAAPVSGQVDRGQLKSFQLGSIVQGAANQWLLAGGMNSNGEQDKDMPQFYLLVRWSDGAGAAGGGAAGAAGGAGVGGVVEQ